MKYNNKLSRYKIKKIIKCFCIDTDATKTALLLNINRWYGIFKRQGRAYTEIIPDCTKVTLQAVIKGKIEIDSVIYSDGWRVYNRLVDVGYAQHFRVNHGNNEFSRGNFHINGIESFWGFTKRRLTKFNGVTTNFEIHFKGCE